MTWRSTPSSSWRASGERSAIIETAVGGTLEQAQTMVMPKQRLTLFHHREGTRYRIPAELHLRPRSKVVPLDVPLRYEVDIWLCSVTMRGARPRVSRVIDWLSSAFDPRLFPWFRREFVSPRSFDAMIEATGARPHRGHCPPALSGT